MSLLIGDKDARRGCQRSAQAFFKLCAVGPAEGAALGYVEQLARSAVGLGCVPQDAALVAYHFSHKLGKLLDGKLLAGSGVYSLVARIIVHQEHAEVGEVVDVEEFAKRRAVAPACNLFKALFLCFVEAADKGRNHMGVGWVVVVVGAVEIGWHHGDVVSAILAV